MRTITSEPLGHEPVATRVCVVCEVAFERRPGEIPSEYARRQSCSRDCWKALQNQGKRQRGAESRRRAAREAASVPVGNSHFAIVDQEDFERVIGHGWFAQVTDHNVYAATRIAGRQILLHRLVLNAEPFTIVDHKNRIGLDCRKANLRLATAGENAFNRKRDLRNTSGFKGVTFHAQTKKWRALLKTGDLWLSLGLHDTPEAAALAYDAAVREHFGEFARLNFPSQNEQSA